MTKEENECLDYSMSFPTCDVSRESERDAYTYFLEISLSLYMRIGGES